MKALTQRIFLSNMSKETWEGARHEWEALEITGVSDIIVEIATHVEEDSWEQVFEMLLDMNQISYNQGARMTQEVYKNLENLK